MEEFLSRHITLAADLQEAGCDTLVRDRLIGDLSSDLIGREWPIGGDSSKIDKDAFYVKFFRAALAKGYGLSKHWTPPKGWDSPIEEPIDRPGPSRRGVLLFGPPGTGKYNCPGGSDLKHPSDFFMTLKRKD